MQATRVKCVIGKVNSARCDRGVVSFLVFISANIMDIFILECLRLGVRKKMKSRLCCVIDRGFVPGELLIESWIQQPASLNYRHPM